MYATVQDLLQFKGKQLLVIEPTQTVARAVEKMNEHNVGSLMVMDHEVLLGIFTERDVLTRIVGEGRTAADTLVQEVMSRMLLTVRPNTPMTEAMKIMTVNRCRHLPVIEQDNSVIGLVSIGDVMRHAIRSLESEVESLASYVTTGSVYPMHG